MYKSISQKSRKPGGRLVGIILFTIFLIVGCAATYFLFIRTYMKVQDAKNWDKTSCIVISSKVRSHTGEDSTTYSVDILYEYKIEGEKKRSNRYSFMGGSSSGRAGKQAIVNRYPSGKKTHCYVNPDDPNEAVLKREFTAMMYFGLIPAVFALVGLGGLIAMVSSGMKETVSPESPGVSAATPLAAAREQSIYDMVSRGPVTIEPKQGPVGKLVKTIIFCLIWNGIISIIIWHLFLGDTGGDRRIPLKLFMIPFVLVGLATLIGVFYYLLALFNPRPTLTISSKAVPLGGAFELGWKMSGRSNIIRNLTITLEGKEQATYRRGTNTCTDNEVFARIPIVETAEPAKMASGSVATAVPDDTMHTFYAENNKIIWTLKIHGDVPRWPDVKEEFEIQILPVRTGEK